MTNYNKLLDSMRAAGMDYRWAGMFVKKFEEAERTFSTTPEETEWAIKRGFYPGKVQFYGLTEENWQDFIPDYNYFMLHPMNNHFLKWLDKTTLKYVLNSNGCEDTMPEYYVYIENDGSYTYLMDCPDYIPKDKDFLLNLLKDKSILMMKPNSGTSGGVGIVKMEIRDGVLYANNKPITMERFEEIRDSMRNYVITEYAHQHSELAKIWPDSECTLRVIMVRNVRNDPYAPSKWSCAVSYARFGAAISGGASNMSSGGIGVGFDFETGAFMDFGTRMIDFCGESDWKIYEHPDTKIPWKTMTMPNWSFVKGRINAICQQISSLEYLGLDIIITEDGMKLCEINTHPSMDYDQLMSGIPLRKEGIREYFTHKGLFDIDTNVYYQAYLDSQE